MLDTQLHEVELEDGTIDWYYVNQIAECILAQVDSEGHECLVMREICDHRKNIRAISIDDGYIVDCHGVKQPKITLDGWEVLIEWKDSLTSWVQLKDVKDRNPIELTEYTVANKILEEPAFKWWVSKALWCRNRVILKATSKYGKTMHKFSVLVPHTAEGALKLNE